MNSEKVNKAIRKSLEEDIMCEMKKEFKVDQRVRFKGAQELNGLTGIILGKAYLDIFDEYIVLLDTPMDDRKAICITECCLEAI